MSFKIPCGGFKLDEKSFSLDKNDVLSIPKPLTYDYMPEGYPSKGIEYVTLMEEQEVTFSNMGGVYQTTAPVKIDISDGQTYTIVWDGVEYSCVCHARGPITYIGNPKVEGLESTGEPFLYENVDSQSVWVSYDTATSHTIKVMRQQVTITPMSADFIPKNFNIAFRSETGNLPTSCNVTYDELREWVTNGIPVLAVFNTGNKVCVLGYINIGDSSIAFKENSKASAQFYYNSDGTFSGEVGPS